MTSRLKVPPFMFWFPFLVIGLSVVCVVSLERSSVLAVQHIESESNKNSADTTVASEEKQIDRISLKQQEMRGPIVLVQARQDSGSGTIIDSIDTDTEDMFEYRVLTSSHVISSRFISHPKRADAITGKVETCVVDVGCRIITFDYQKRTFETHRAIVVAENKQHDLAILSFESNQKLTVAKIADENMLRQVRVFDEVFAVGCQLRNPPSPTFGIISRILTGIKGQEKWTIYVNSAHIAFGSSGGGLFKEYNDHYYLIGVPYGVSTTDSDQIIPHLSIAVSVSTARNLIDQSSVTHP